MIFIHYIYKSRKCVIRTPFDISFQFSVASFLFHFSNYSWLFVFCCSLQIAAMHNDKMKSQTKVIFALLIIKCFPYFICVNKIYKYQAAKLAIVAWSKSPKNQWKFVRNFVYFVSVVLAASAVTATYFCFCCYTVV